MLDPRLLVTLEAVVRLGSFAAAASELGYTQSAVSQQVAELERRAGLRVLERRPVRPTAAGTILLRAEGAVRTAMTRAAAELTALDDGRTGEVRLAAFISAAGSIVPPALARFRETHPGVHVTLTQHETDASYRALLRGDLDLAVTFDYDRSPQPAPAGVRRTPIGTDPVVVALPARHPLAPRPAVSLADLAGEAWLATPVERSLRSESSSTVAARSLRGAAIFTTQPQFVHSADPKVAFEGDDFRTVLGLVANGLGVALLPALAVTDAAGVIARPIVEEPLVRYVYLCRVDTARTPSMVTRLETHLTETAAGLLGH